MGAEVGDRQRLFRWGGQEQITDGHMHGAGEVFELLERGLCLASLPFRELWETALQLLKVKQTSTLTRPAV